MTIVGVDVVIDSAHRAVDYAQLLLPYYQKFVLLQFPHASLFTLGANAINGATTVFAANADKPRLYWLHSLILVIIGSFGGGTLAPLLIGKPSAIVGNDQIIVLCALAWYATHTLGLQSLLTWRPVKLLWTVFLALFRTHSVVNVVALSMTVLQPTPYYPIPLVGPIVVGTALGCLGMFLPFDKGLAAVKNGTPWNLQGALMTAAFFHLMVHDTTGFLGCALRSVVGTHDAAAAKTIIATFQILALELQALSTPDANLFAPLHKLLYLVTQVQGPVKADPAPVKATAAPGWSFAVGSRLASFVDMARAAVVAGAIIMYLHAHVPQHSLRAVPRGLLAMSAAAAPHSGAMLTQVASTSPLSEALWSTEHWNRQLFVTGSGASALRVGEVVGSCQVLPEWRGCTPYLMRLETTMVDAGSADECLAKAAVHGAVSCRGGYRLAVYRGVSIDSNSTAHFARDLIPLRDEADSAVANTAVRLHLSDSGELFLTKKVAAPAAPAAAPLLLNVVWASETRGQCGEASAAGLRVDHQTGKPVVVCSDGSEASI